MISILESRVLVSNRRKVALGLGIALVCVTLPFAEVLFGTRTSMWSDIVAAQVPRSVAVWANIRHGFSPFWWRNIFGGFNTLGGGESGIFYPPNAIFGWLSPVNAFRWWFLGHLWVTTAGWYTWAWRRWQSVLGATVCAIGATINGYVLYHSTSMAFIAAWMLLPWAFLTLDRLIETARVRYVAILAVLIAGMAIQLAQFLWLTLIALGVCAVFSLWRRGLGLGPWLRVGVAVVLGIGLAAVQLLPSVAYSKTSVRPTLTRVAAFEFSMEPRHLSTLLAPNIMGGANGLWWTAPWRGGPLINELATYLGITFAALAVIGVIRLGRNRLSMALVALAVLGVLASLGGRTFVGNLIFDFVPFANRFRAWARDLLWTYLAVAILAGAGAREVARMPRKWGMRLMVSAAAFGALMLALPAITDLGGAMLHGGEGALARFIPPLLLLALGGAVLAMTRSRVIGAAALIAVCALDLGLFAFTAPWRSSSLKPSAVSATINNNSPPPFGAAVSRPGGISRWVSDIPDASAFWPSVIGHQSQSVNGYDPLLQADYSKSLGYMAYLGYMPVHVFWEGGWMPDVLRVTTLLASPYAGQVSTRFTYSHRYTLPDPSTVAQTNDVYTYTPRLPESYLIGATRVSSLDTARAALTIATDTDLTQYAYVDEGTIPTSEIANFTAIAAPGFSGSVTSGAMNDGGSGTWAVTATRPSLFVTSYAWMDGWHATVDGKSVPVARTNAVVLGVPVPTGTHTVHLSFTPPGWAEGRAVSLASLLVLIVLLLSDRASVRSLLRRRLGRATSSEDSEGS